MAVRRSVIVGVLSVAVVTVALVISSADHGDDARVDGDPTAASTTTASDGTPSPNAPASTTTTRGPRGNGAAVTFAFAGDVNFPEVWDTEDGPPPNAPTLAEQVRADPEHVLDAVTPVLSGADLAMVNVETADHRRRRAGGREELPLPIACGDVRRPAARRASTW